MDNYVPPTTPTKFKPTKGTVVLAKPFKSPLKRLHGDDDSRTDSPKTIKIQQDVRTPLGLFDLQPNSATSNLSSSPLKRMGLFSSSVNGSPNTSPLHKSCQFREKFLAGVKNERVTIDPVLVKQESALDISLRQMRQKITQCQQAHKYESATTKLVDGNVVPEDENLVVLIDKWRAAAQNAAKYLFDLAEVRVAKMGGVAEFRRRTKRRGFDDDNDDDEEKRRVEDVGEDELARLRDEYDYDVVADGKKANGASVNYDGDEEFTMDMMLGVLNIDPNIVFPK
ncbi:hypothetical protein POJ06DRAFT_246180 [Lipomyces tetrasporus]|uniref:Uncharacterized protein n=1 Tax=Lipomyces tetrasporus TaxID=54092 RepID=A0AAD7QX87_9ASCO|nr:uncharacterized protein POJ06DRAFT_246180 [Lipomyces tetrasporus]KAJ8102963.1 hypothetical protein POJ06DRAFT_246180 [Lipomyces tetrasporus]